VFLFSWWAAFSTEICPPPSSTHPHTLNLVLSWKSQLKKAPFPLTKPGWFLPWCVVHVDENISVKLSLAHQVPPLPRLCPCLLKGLMARITSRWVVREPTQRLVVTNIDYCSTSRHVLQQRT
jgi:hypothetical protein